MLHSAPHTMKAVILVVKVLVTSWSRSLGAPVTQQTIINVTQQVLIISPDDHKTTCSGNNNNRNSSNHPLATEAREREGICREISEHVSNGEFLLRH